MCAGAGAGAREGRTRAREQRQGVFGRPVGIFGRSVIFWPKIGDDRQNAG
jgi:hypothetical protein